MRFSLNNPLHFNIISELLTTSSLSSPNDSMSAQYAIGESNPLRIDKASTRSLTESLGRAVAMKGIAGRYPFGPGGPQQFLTYVLKQFPDSSQRSLGLW